MYKNTSPLTTIEDFSADSIPTSCTISDFINEHIDNAAGDTILTPKSGTKYASPDEDFGVIPVSATSDYEQAPPADRSLNNSSTGETLSPKPGTKYAA